MVSDSLGSQKELGAQVQQSSQVLDEESQLQTVGPGTGFLLGVTINLEPQHLQPILSERGPASRRAVTRPSSLPWEWHGYHSKSLKFGDSNWGLVPEVETPGHRLGTRQTRVIVHFSMQAQ